MDYKSVTRESYNKHAEYFSDYFGKRLDFKRRCEFKKFLSYLKGKNILDLGSGSGEHALYFKENGLDVKCVDISEAMVRLCRGKGLKANIMDIENIKFENEMFDGIWAATSLLHVPKEKMEGVAERLSSILREKGILFVEVKEGEGEGLVPDKHDEGTKRFFSFWTKKELIRRFKKNFNLIDFWKDKFKDTTYLNFFFEK